jgi:SAP domain-containing new25
MKLAKSMTLQEFDNRYWYITELKSFADSLGIAGAARMRKNELELAITTYLRTGRAPVKSMSRPMRKGVKDLTRGLSLKLRIEHYTSNRQTKDFISQQARRQDPSIKEKSGVWYRLNRWREAQMDSGAPISYGDLVGQYMILNRQKSFEKIPHGRYINFLADYLKHEPEATRPGALGAWKKLKKMDAPKTYVGWKAAGSRCRKAE